jgi:hypothetical protein
MVGKAAGGPDSRSGGIGYSVKDATQSLRHAKIVGVNFLSGYCYQCLGTLHLYPVCLIYTLHTQIIYHAELAELIPYPFFFPLSRS